MTPILKYNALLKEAGNELLILTWPHKQQRIELSNGVVLTMDDVRRFRSRCSSVVLSPHMDAIYASDNTTEQMRDATASVFCREYVSNQQKQLFLTASAAEQQRKRQQMLRARASRQTIGFMPGCEPWNKGETKATNDTLQRLSVQRGGSGNPMYGKHHTDELKLARSTDVKNRIERGEWTPHVHNSRTHWQDKINGKPYRSSWEVMYQLLNPSATYESIRIHYEHDGVRRIYIVDFELPDARKIIEVKPDRHKATETNRLKFLAAEKWATENGYTFEVVSQQYFIDHFDQLPVNLADYIPNAAIKLRKIKNEADKKNKN